MPRSPRLSVLALETRDVPAVITEPVLFSVPEVGDRPALVATTTTGPVKLTVSSTTAAFGDTLTLTAAPLPAGGPATGTITFKDGPLTLGTVPLDGDSATITWRANRVGDHAITAVFTSGTTRLTSEALTVTVARAELISPTLVATPAAPASGQWMRLRFDYTTSGDPRDAIGTVTFKDNGTVIGTAPVRPGRAVELAFNAPAPGQHEYAAEYSGNANTMPATAEPLTVTVGPKLAATTRTTLEAAARPVTGRPFELRAVVRKTNGNRVDGGTVTFKLAGEGGDVIGTAPVVNGEARMTYTVMTFAPAGSMTAAFVAHYTGTATTMDSDSAVLTLTSKVDTRLNLRVGTAVAGRPVALTATLAFPTSGDPAPTGRVTFRDGSRVLGTVPLGANGVTSFTANGLTNGMHSLSAVYEGDAAYYAATSPALSVAFKKASSVALSVVGTPLTAGRPLSLRVTVTGSTRPTGLVTFRDGSTFLGVVALDANGRASLSLTRGLTRGTHALTATYGGDATLAMGVGSASATLA